MNVEAKAKVRQKVVAPRKRKPQPSAPVAAPARPSGGEAVASQAPGGEPSTGAPADANPNAAPGAPYNVTRSANSRLTQPLINTPRTVTAIPKEVIEDKGATSVRELVRTTPGLTLGTGEGGNAFGDRVFIRGFDARNDMYIDGIRESGVSTRETFMTEQVEITKGPAGAISGRGAAGGSVNIVTKQPTQKDFTEFTSMVGSDMTRRLSADVSRNISPDFAVRVNALLHKSNVSGRDHVFDDRYGASLSSVWRPREDFKATFDVYYVKMNAMPDWGVPFDPRTHRPFTESGLNRTNFYGVLNRDFQHNQQAIATQGLEWKVNPFLTITSRTRYGQTITDYVASKPGTPNLTNPNPALWTVAATPASRYQVNTTIANVTEATSKFTTGAFDHTLVTGVEAQRERVSQDTYSGLSVECNPLCTTGVTTNLWNPVENLGAVVGSPVRNGAPTHTNVSTLAAYALDTMSWNDRLFINFGGRGDSYSVTRQSFTGAPIKRDDFLFNWNVGVTYKVLPNASVYAAYATSSNPVGSELDGGADDYGGLTLANSVFRPERNTSLEVGTKWEFFDKRAMFTAAYFETTKRNARETVGTVLQDTAAYKIHGLELGATGNLTDQWSVFGGVVLMKSEVTDSALAANLGRPLANIAHTSFNLLTKYRVTEKLTIGAQATYKGPILGGTIAAAWRDAGTVNVGGALVATPAGYNELPGGWRFDLLSEYQITKTITAKAQVLNVFNATLYDAFYRSANPYVYVAPGRTGYLTLQAKF
jgi:catecholate siderophore receptor